MPPAQRLADHWAMAFAPRNPAAIVRHVDMRSLNHEWCFYGWREGGAHQFFGPANVTDLWSVKKVNPQHMVHLTEKPVELPARAIEYSSKRGRTCWTCLAARARR